VVAPLSAHAVALVGLLAHVVPCVGLALHVGRQGLLAVVTIKVSQSCPTQAMAVVNTLQRQLTNMLAQGVANTAQLWYRQQ